MSSQGERLDADARRKHLALMTNDCRADDSPLSLEEVIFALCGAAKDGRTVCPTQAAQAFAAARGEDEMGWRSHLTAVRRSAIRLAQSGRLVIFRKGKPVHPLEFRGVYRLGLPNDG